MDRRSFQELNAEDQATLHFSPACAPEDIICSGSDTEESDESIRQKRLRYEEQARRCIRGRLPILQSASLRGPLDRESGWINPWRYRTPESPSWWQPGSEEMLFTRSNVMKRAADHGLGYLTPAEALAWCKRTAMFEAESAERSSPRTGMVESNSGRMVDEENEEEEQEGLAAFSNAAQADTTLMRGTGQRLDTSPPDFGQQSQESTRGVKRPVEWLKGSYVSKRARWNGPSIATPTPLHSSGRDEQRRRNMVPRGSTISSRGQHSLESFRLPAPQTPRPVSLEPSKEQEPTLDDVNIPQHSPHHEQTMVQQEPTQVSHHRTLYAEDSSTLKYEDSNTQILRENWEGNTLQHARRDSLDLSQISPFVVNFGSSKLDLNLQTSTPNYNSRPSSHFIQLPDLENSSRGFDAVGSSNHSLPKLPHPSTTTSSRFAQATPAIIDDGSFVTEVAPSSRNVEEFQFKKKRRHPKTPSPVPVTVKPDSEPVIGMISTRKPWRRLDGPKPDPASDLEPVERIIPENHISPGYPDAVLRESTSPRMAIHPDEKDTKVQSPLQDTPSSDDSKQGGSLHSPVAHILTDPSQTKVPTPSPQGKGKLAPFTASSLASPSQKLPSLLGQIPPSGTQGIAEPANLLKPCDSSNRSFITTTPKSARSARGVVVFSNSEIQDEEHQEDDNEQLKGHVDYEDEQLPGKSDDMYLASNSQPVSQHTSRDLKGALMDLRSLQGAESSSKSQTSGDGLIEEADAREKPPCPSDSTNQAVNALVSQSHPEEVTRTPSPRSQVVEPGAQTPWARTHTQPLLIMPAMAPELEAANTTGDWDVVDHLGEPVDSPREQPQECDPTDSISWHPTERSMTPDSNHIKLLKDLMTPPSPARRSQTINSLPSTQLIFNAALENPWTNKGKQVRSVNRKIRKRVSFENLPSEKSDDSEDDAPIPTGTMHSPPPPLEIEDDDDILEEVVVKGFRNHFRATRRATRLATSGTSDLLNRRPFTRLILEQENSIVNSSPSVGAMAEAFIAADREASLGLQQNSPPSMSRHLKPRSESMDNAGRQSHSDGEQIGGNSEGRKTRGSSLLSGFEMDDILGEVDGYLEHWSIDTELERARQQQSKAESNGAKRKRLFGIV